MGIVFRKHFRLSRLIISGGLASVASLFLGVLSSEGIMGIFSVIRETSLPAAIIISILIGIFAGGPAAIAIMLPVCSLGFVIGAQVHAWLQLHVINALFNYPINNLLTVSDLLNFSLIGLYQGFSLGLGLGLYIVLKNRYRELKSALHDQTNPDGQALIKRKRDLSRWLILVAVLLFALQTGSFLIWWYFDYYGGILML